jgi:hypothetical protein
MREKRSILFEISEQRRLNRHLLGVLALWTIFEVNNAVACLLPVPYTVYHFFLFILIHLKLGHQLTLIPSSVHNTTYINLVRYHSRRIVSGGSSLWSARNMHLSASNYRSR